MANLKANPKLGNMGGWQERHNAAVKTPYMRQNERPLVGMLKQWAQYAETHKERFDSLVGDDGVLGPEWESIGRGIRGLLNGESGRLDCGTLDAFILDTLAANGIEEE